MRRLSGLTLVPVFGLVLVGLLLASCGGADPESSGAGEWTVQDGALQLTENLRVSDNEAFYFGDIRDVAVGREGRIYVADRKDGHTVLRATQRPDPILR